MGQTKALKAFQEAEDGEEAVCSIPLLKRTDISRETPVVLNTKVGDSKGTKILHHDYFTNGIAYLTLLFDTREVPDELIPYMGILKSVLGYVSTEHFTYSQLFHEINSCTGGISCGLQVFPEEKGEDSCVRMFGVRAKYLYPQQSFVRCV